MSNPERAVASSDVEGASSIGRRVLQMVALRCAVARFMANPARRPRLAFFHRGIQG
jgi:hypothetical protein